MKRSSLVVAMLLIVSSLTGCAAVASDSPAASHGTPEAQTPLVGRTSVAVRDDKARGNVALARHASSRLLLDIRPNEQPDELTVGRRDKR